MAIKQLGKVHFVRQEFRQALPILKNAPDLEDLFGAARKYQDRVRPLPLNDFFQLLDEIELERVPVRLGLLKFDATIRQPQPHSKIVEHYLKTYKNLATLNFEYDEGLKRLDLSKNPSLQDTFSDHSYYLEPFNFLSSLPIDLLVLDDTKCNQKHPGRFSPNRNCEVVFR